MALSRKWRKTVLNMIFSMALVMASATLSYADDGVWSGGGFSLIEFFKTHPMSIVVTILLVIVAVGILMMNYKKKDQTQQLEEANAALEAAVQAAERATETRTRFLSQMSHEIRTPMNAIVGLTDLAKANIYDPDKVEEYLDKISISSKVLLSIVNDVLDMSSLENEKIKIAAVEFDLNQVLDGIDMIYQSQCRSKGIEFVLRKNFANQTFIGDSLRINQILLNLVSNAYKFTEGGGRIEVTASEINRREDEVYIRLTVEDTGEGMTDEMLKRIFKPFEQESTATARKHGGSGLGMSITKNLVEMMHGVIRVESAKGVGTRFTVDLPFKVTGEIKRETAKEVSKIQFLLAGDNAQDMEYVQMLVMQFGVEAETVFFDKEGNQAENQMPVYAKGYDICLLDELDDYSATYNALKTLREKLGPDTHLVLATALKMDDIRAEMNEIGVNQLIRKPILQGVVREILSDKVARAKEGVDDNDFDFSGYKVILAEDNEINAEIMQELLKNVNMDVDYAENGVEAVELFNSAEPGTYIAVLMDLQMPEMDGLEAARQIRGGSHADALSVPIIAQSANAFNEDVALALAAGMNAHISKPISSKELYRTLRKCVNKEF